MCTPGAQESVPEETVLVFHTLHVPHASSDPNMWEADAYLPQHVAQLNAAGRQARTIPPPMPHLKHTNSV